MCLHYCLLRRYSNQINQWYLSLDPQQPITRRDIGGTNDWERKTVKHTIGLDGQMSPLKGGVCVWCGGFRCVPSGHPFLCLLNLKTNFIQPHHHVLWQSNASYLMEIFFWSKLLRPFLSDESLRLSRWYFATCIKLLDSEIQLQFFPAVDAMLNDTLHLWQTDRAKPFY